MNLREWRKSKGWGQADLADKIGSNQKTYSAYETGRNDISAEVQAKLRKLGYVGPWPRVEALAASAPTNGHVTREEFAELRGALGARIDVLERAVERMGELVRDLVRESELSRPQGRKG